MLGHHGHASETVFRWQADDGPLIVVFRSSLPSSIKKNTKTPVKVGTPLTKWSGSGHAILIVYFLFQLIASFFKHTKMESSPQETPRRRDKRRSLVQGQVDLKRECLLAMIGQIDSQSTPLYLQKQLLHIFALLNNKV